MITNANDSTQDSISNPETDYIQMKSLTIDLEETKVPFGQNGNIATSDIMVNINDTAELVDNMNKLKVQTTQKENIRVAVIGNVDSGKSTLTAILSSANGVTDDGRGAMREKVFNFTHEKENGRTSSIAHEIMGFDMDGNQILPKKKNAIILKKKDAWPEIV